MRYKPYTPEERAQITEDIRALLPMPVYQIRKKLGRSEKTIIKCFPRDIPPTYEPWELAALPDTDTFDWEKHRADFIIMEVAA